MTEREKELFDALGKAIEAYQYASMTSWEREVTEDDRRQCEAVLAKYKGGSHESSNRD